VSVRSQGPLRTNRPFLRELPKLLQELKLTPTEVARAAGIAPSHLSRVLRAADYKTPSAELSAKIAKVLDLPVQYFPEYREAVVVRRVKTDPLLRDTLFDDFSGEMSKERIPE